MILTDGDPFVPNKSHNDKTPLRKPILFSYNNRL